MDISSAIQAPVDQNQHLLFGFPCTLLLLDDDEILLASLKRMLSFEHGVVAFSSSTLAFQYVMQSQTVREQSFNMFEPYLHEIEESENGDDLIMIKSSKLKELAASAEKYKMISVAIIDQIMPRISGTEFCKQIEDTGIRKILLTGQMTNSETIDAFNAGLIDGFVSKNDPQIKTKLQTLISKLHMDFIREQTEHIVRAFDASHRQFLGHFAIGEILRLAGQQFPYSEFFYAPAIPGFILANETGDRSLCIIDTHQSQMELAELLAEEHGYTAGIQGLIDGKAICWNPFTKTSSNELASIENLNAHIFPCENLNEFRWCLAPINKTPYSNENFVHNWSTHKEMVNLLRVNSHPSFNDE